MSDTHVDNVLGLDTNTGLTWAQAYKTISKAVSADSPISAGDDVIVRHNVSTPYDLLTDEGGQISFEKSGTVGNPITVHPEFPGLVKPIIDVSGAPTGTDDVFDLKDNNYIDIEEFEVDGSNLTGQIDGIFDVNQCSFINIRKCNCHDLDIDAAGLKATASNQTPPANNIVVEDCDFVDIADSVSSTSSVLTFGNSNVNNIIVLRCNFSGLVDEGIKFQWEDAAADMNTVLVEDCSFIGVTGPDLAIKQSRDITIRGCYFGPGLSDSVELHGSHGVLIDDCKFRGTQSRGIEMLGAQFGGTWFRCGDITIRRCDFDNIGLTGSGGNPRAIDCAFLTDDYGDAVRIYNCTINGTLQQAGSGGDGIRIRLNFAAEDSEGSPTIRIKGCILTNNADRGIDITGDDPGVGEAVTIDNDYNCYDGNTGENIDTSGITRWTINDPETNGLTQDTDPLYVDEPNGKLRLVAGSPCIGAGDSSALASLHGGAADIGGHEYGAPVGSRLKNGKYYDGQTAIPDNKFELVNMER